MLSSIIDFRLEMTFKMPHNLSSCNICLHVTKYYSSAVVDYLDRFPRRTEICNGRCLRNDCILLQKVSTEKVLNHVVREWFDVEVPGEGVDTDDLKE